MSERATGTASSHRFAPDERDTGGTPELALVCPELRAALIDALPPRDPDGWIPRRFEAPSVPHPPPVQRRERGRALIAVAAMIVRWTLTALGVAVLATSALTAVGQTPEPRLESVAPALEPANLQAALVAWDATGRASVFGVEVRRRGVPVLRLTRRTPDFRLPSRWVFAGRPWALEAGTYSYTARAGRDAQSARKGRVVAHGTFTVTPTAP
jgi:hypothetical protein